jgi:hypothetical protein
MINRFKVYCKLAVTKTVVKRAIFSSVVVGIILNLINQYSVVVNFDLSHLDLTKFFLTFLVPYCVSTYTAVALQLELLKKQRR